MNILFLKKAVKETFVVMGMAFVFIATNNLLPNPLVQLSKRGSFFVLVMFIMMTVGEYFRLKSRQE